MEPLGLLPGVSEWGAGSSSGQSYRATAHGDLIPGVKPGRVWAQPGRIWRKQNLLFPHRPPPPTCTHRTFYLLYHLPFAPPTLIRAGGSSWEYSLPHPTGWIPLPSFLLVSPHLSPLCLMLAWLIPGSPGQTQGTSATLSGSPESKPGACLSTTAHTQAPGWLMLQTHCLPFLASGQRSSLCITCRHLGKLVTSLFTNSTVFRLSSLYCIGPYRSLGVCSQPSLTNSTPPLPRCKASVWSLLGLAKKVGGGGWSVLLSHSSSSGTANVNACLRGDCSSNIMRY